MTLAESRTDHVFATDLPEGLDEQSLRMAFEGYGRIVWCRIFKGMGKTAALLQYSSADEANIAVDNANNIAMFEGHGPVTVTHSEGSNPKKKAKGCGKKGGREGPYGAVPVVGGAHAQPQLVNGNEPSMVAPFATIGKGCSKFNFGGMGPASIQELKADLLAEGILPAGRWQNDDGALHVGGLPPDTTDKDLYEIFSPFGAIPSGGVRAMLNPGCTTCTGVGFVNFVEPAAAQQVIMLLNGRTLRNGQVLHVTPKQKKS